MTRGWKIFLVLSFVAGLFLRTLYVNDMEYKEDERYNYAQSQLIGTTEPWPAYGIASGAFIVNPGMSIWVFAGLAKLTGAHSPTQLARAVQLFAILGISLVLVYALLLPPEKREPWYWVFALAMVNPIAILYQRKLWPEPFLPFFTMLLLMGWWFREKRWGAFLWGWIGALVGQIHMSGFFLAAGYFLWTVFFSTKRRAIEWRYWLIGSILGGIPLIPWLQYLIANPTHTSLEGGWGEAIQLKYWVFWISGAFGLHLGNTLGIYIGDTQWEQLSDFVRYPLIGGHPTYIVGLAHLGILFCVSWMVLQLVRFFERTLGKNFRAWRDQFIGRESDAAFAQNAAFWGSGILMELTNLNIRRYYVSVVFPFEFLWLTRLALRNPLRGRSVLALLWICQFLVSAGFVHYIHVNHGSPQGDYGVGYENQK